MPGVFLDQNLDQYERASERVIAEHAYRYEHRKILNSREDGPHIIYKTRSVRQGRLLVAISPAKRQIMISRDNKHIARKVLHRVAFRRPTNRDDLSEAEYALAFCEGVEDRRGIIWTVKESREVVRRAFSGKIPCVVLVTSEFGGILQ